MRKILFVFLFLLSSCSGVYLGKSLPDLRGKDSDDVMAVFGKPVAERREGNFKMWGYCQSDCSTLIFFDVDNIVQYAEQRGHCAEDMTGD